MKLSLNVIIQILATIIHAANMASGILPAKYQALVVLIVGLIQSVSALLAHFANPDGTPAITPYVPPK